VVAVFRGRRVVWFLHFSIVDKLAVVRQGARAGGCARTIRRKLRAVVRLREFGSGRAGRVRRRGERDALQSGPLHLPAPSERIHTAPRGTATAGRSDGIRVRLINDYSDTTGPRMTCRAIWWERVTLLVEFRVGPVLYFPRLVLRLRYCM